jgi:hypothetical protein
MNPFADRFEDTLEPLGVAVGTFLALVAIATILGMPWAVKDTLAAVVQIVGALGTVAVGAGLAYLSWTGGE